MKDKPPVEQLRDKVAEILTELLDFAEPFIIMDQRESSTTGNRFEAS